MSTRRKKIKTSQNFVRSNKIVQKGGNIHAQELLDILEEEVPRVSPQLALLI